MAFQSFDFSKMSSSFPEDSQLVKVNKKYFKTESYVTWVTVASLNIVGGDVNTLFSSLAQVFKDSSCVIVYGLKVN